MVDGHRIEFGEKWDGWDGQWVRIKPWLSYASQQAIQDAFNAPGDDHIGAPQSMLRFNAAVTEHQVIEWHILGYDGAPLPQGPAALLSDLAPSDVMEHMFGEIADYYGKHRPPPFRRPATPAPESSDSESSTPPNRAQRRRAARSSGASSPKT